MPEQRDLYDVLATVLGGQALAERAVKALYAAGYAVVSTDEEALGRARLALLERLPGVHADLLLISLSRVGVYLAERPRLRQDLFGLPGGGMMATHPSDRCLPHPCCVHRPSRHPLNQAPLEWSGERYVMYRVCPHAQWHPDPDHLSWVARVDGDKALRDAEHPCDGCCAPPRPVLYSQS